METAVKRSTHGVIIVLHRANVIATVRGEHRRGEGAKVAATA